LSVFAFLLSFFICIPNMADNTRFILPQWYLPREPGMKCEPHSKIIGMLAAYDVVSVIMSLTLSSSFFFGQTKWLLDRFTIVYTSFRKLFGYKPAPEDTTSYWKFPLPSFAMSALGSILISLSAPLLAGTSITNNHPNANTWVLIEQWATRPRATFFIWIFNTAAVFMKRGSEGERNPEQKNNSFLTTTIVVVATELVVSLFPIRFLNNQYNTPHSTFDRSLPCTSYGPPYLGPIRRSDENNCPDMQSSAYGLLLLTPCRLLPMWSF